MNAYITTYLGTPSYRRNHVVSDSPAAPLTTTKLPDPTDLLNADAVFDAAANC